MVCTVEVMLELILVDEVIGEVGNVGEGAVLDFPISAIGLPHQVANIGAAAVLAFDRGYM